MVLGLVAAVLCLSLVLAGASMGSSGSVAFSQPSPSGSSAGPSGSEIFLLNPSPAYRPPADIQEPPQPAPTPDDPEATNDDPKISDKPNGNDEGYHVVAVVNDPPSTALVEAYWAADGENEVTVGQLSPVAGRPDTYELFWDIPDSIDAGPGVFTVRLYEQRPSGFEQVSEHAVDAYLHHSPVIYLAGGPVAPADTAELTWPTQGGPLGFYKGAGTGAAWKTVVSGTASNFSDPDPTSGDVGSGGTAQVRIFYSTTPIGLEPTFTLCATAGTGGGGPGGSRTFNGTCTLQGADRPSQVTSIAAVAMENHDQSGEGEPVYSQESADVHRTIPYLQQLEDMKIDLQTFTYGSQTLRRHIVAGSACIAYRVTVTDILDRPVQGANVDFHVRGPGDQVQFGTTTGNGNVHSTNQVPQKGHSDELSRNCNDRTLLRGTHGDHNVPGANDIKHIESGPGGTGGSGGSGVSFGQFGFVLYSANVGQTDITAWVDDEPVANDSAKREADDDLPEISEKTDTNFVQWLPAAPAVTIDPPGATAAIGQCQRYVVRVRGGGTPVKGANVDVHATGPSNDLDFCDPPDASERKAPQGGTGHAAEDTGESAHAGEPPVAQHTEGETNDQGNFVVGLTSPVAGDTTITAWYDAGEAPFDNDDLSGEASGTATTNWVVSAEDAAISFVNPSPYGPGGEGTRVSNKQDVDSGYHLVARTASVQPITGVEFFVRTGSEPLAKIGDGTQVSSSDTWETYWNADVAEGSHTLVARILGTTIQVEQAITVNNDAGTDPRDVPDESAEITAPLNGERASFTRGKLTIRGVTSAGSEGVDLYYTKASALTTPQTGSWISCGFASVASGSAPKEFSGECTLASGDQPAQVTGIAALPYDCIQAGCNAAPGAGPGGVRNPGARDSGDAHRVFGVEANPLIALEPAETASDVGGCTRLVLNLTDQTGQPMGGENVDVHLSGPADEAGFCDPGDGTASTRRAPDQGAHTADGNEPGEAYHQEAGRVHHTEAETTSSNGRFVFGVHSDSAGDSTVDVWLDSNDNDVQDSAEPTDRSIVHWDDDEQPSSCDIAGTPGDDTLIGTAAGERICGAGGNDVIKGRGGNDVLVGAAGNDHLRGNGGNDVVRGNAGNDRAFGGGGKDRVLGGGGNDAVGGNKANDRLRGHGGRDRLNGGMGRDACNGGRGRDQTRNCESSLARAGFARRTRLI